MSDSSVPDCPFHVFLEKLAEAQAARIRWKKAKLEVDDLHPLDGAFRSADLKGILTAAEAAYAEARKEAMTAFDKAIPDELWDAAEK